MSNIKNVILCSAAVLGAATGAQAADLPVKAKAVQYVKICSLYGAGFYYIPGTETCIKLGGFIQVDVNIAGNNFNKPAWDESPVSGAGAFGTGSRNSDYFTTRSRAQLNLDTRTASEYGVIRTYWSSNFEHTTGTGPSAGNLTMDFGFVQFAGFTFGKAVSTFQTPWGSYGGNNNSSGLLGGYDNATGITQIAYTWQLGNGVSAQLGLEDNRIINRAQLLNANQVQPATAALTGAYTSAYGGNVVPEITGNIRIDQTAFTAQLSGALHNVHATYYAATTALNAGATLVEPNGHPTDEWGGAVSGGIQLKNLPTGPGDKLSFDGTYANGAMKYLIGGVTGNNFDRFSGDTNFAGSYQSVAVLSLFDGVFTTGNKIEKTSGWAFRGGYVHNWTPNWETSVFGSYTHVDYNTNASAALCGVQVLNSGAKFNGYSCNPDFNIYQVGTRTAWTPVTNLTLSGEVLYTYLDQSNTGSATLTAANVAGTFKPTGVYDYKDQGIWSGSLRARRTW